MAKNRLDKVWPDGILKPRLDEFLDDKPAVSPPVTVPLGSKDVEVCFRALDRQTIEWLKWEAWRYVLTMIEANKLDPKYIESTQGLDAINNENQIRLLHASMIDPEAWEKDKTIAPVFKLEHFREVVVPAELDIMDHKRWTWQTSKTIGQLSDEQIAEIEAEAKKKSPDPAVLMGYGSAGLLICISSMAAQLEILRMSKFSDGSSGDGQSNNPTEDTNPLDNSLQSLFTRLSASLDEKITEAVAPLHREIEQLKAGAKRGP